MNPRRPQDNDGGGRKAVLADFFEQARDVYLQAERAFGGSLCRRFRVGGRLLALYFAGPALASRLTPALEHLAVPADGAMPEFTIFLWDSVSTGTRMPPPPWSARDYAGRGEVRGFGDDRFRLAFHPGSGILNMADTRAGIALYWIRDAGQVPYYESGAPLLPLLNWWLNGLGFQVVHAAAVGHPSGGILFIGKGGSGKSTAALSCCFRGGFLYAGDDYCLIEPGALRVHSLFNSAKLDWERLRMSFPQLEAAVSDSGRLDGEKPLVFLQRHWPQLINPVFPIRAVLIPRLTGRPPTTLTPAKPMDIAKALAPSTIFQLAAAGGDELRLIAELVRGSSGFFLELGTDLDAIGPVLSRLLEPE